MQVMTAETISLSSKLLLDLLQERGLQKPRTRNAEISLQNFKSTFEWERWCADMAG
jgi:hypothetical protein